MSRPHQPTLPNVFWPHFLFCSTFFVLFGGLVLLSGMVLANKDQFLISLAWVAIRSSSSHDDSWSGKLLTGDAIPSWLGSLERSSDRGWGWSPWKVCPQVPLYLLRESWQAFRMALTLNDRVPSLTDWSYFSVQELQWGYFWLAFLGTNWNTFQIFCWWVHVWW